MCAQRRLRSAWASAQSDQVFAVRMKKAWVLSYPLSAQQRLWSNWADAQVNPSLRWAHMPFRWFCHERGNGMLIMQGSFHKSTLFHFIPFMLSVPKGEYPDQTPQDADSDDRMQGLIKVYKSYQVMMLWDITEQVSVVVACLRHVFQDTSPRRTISSGNSTWNHKIMSRSLHKNKDWYYSCKSHCPFEVCS